jgi:outer membrane immunogenic protein
MKRSISSALCTLALLIAPALAGTARAAPPLFNWTGFYVGAQGGWGWGDLDDVFHIAPSRSLHGDGGLAGGTLGYNWQSAAWVFGVEGDFAWSDIRVDGRNATVFGICTSGGLGVCGATLENFGTVRGRLGYAVGGVLFYGTAGLGFGDLKGFITVPAIGNASSTRFSTGFVYGGGIEAMIGNNWSAKVEYLHYDAGNSSAFTFPGFLDSWHADDWRADIVRVGLNYKFGY